MKKIITAFVFCFLCGECFSQAGEWVWIKGDSVPNQPGNYGVQGVPSPTNNPPSLYEPCEWTDLNGNFWLFGGVDGSSTNGDLWKYEPLINEWTWIKGSALQNDPGNFGIQGVPSLSNNPPSRGYGAITWVDNLNNLWLFAGDGNDVFSDLWRFNINTNEWTWMKGSSIPNQPGIYGLQGISSASNNPGSRGECASAWTDSLSSLWFFGGDGLDSLGTHGFLNDLWKYNILNNEWTWMKGSPIAGQSGIYGTLGIENPSNIPGARFSYSHWKDNDGMFWLFGGYSGGYFNDMWRFNSFTNNWGWYGGSFSGGLYGSKCISSLNSTPGSRFENRTSYTDTGGNFWTFGGGQGLSAQQIWNDLWKYCVAAHKWIWISGDNFTNPSVSWGIMGVSNPTNKPNGRAGSVGWSDLNGQFYLFGGTTTGFTLYNDLWKYTIDTTCGLCPTPNSIQENNLINGLLIFPNPTNSSFTISFQSSTKQNIELRLYNTLEKQIYVEKEEITKGKFEKEINVEKLGGGIYFLQLKMKDGNINRKVIVNH